MIVKRKCSLCGKTYQGILLSLRKSVKLETIKEIMSPMLGISNVVSLCGNGECKTNICNECLSKLEVQKGFLGLKNTLICPTCQKGLGGKPASVLICGRFPNAVVTEMEKDRYGFTYPNKVNLNFMNSQRKPLLPRECAYCGSDERVESVTASTTVTTYRRGIMRFTYSYFVCAYCKAVVNHRSIHHPGAPYTVSQDFSGTNMYTFRFAHSSYAKKFQESNQPGRGLDNLFSMFDGGVIIKS